MFRIDRRLVNVSGIKFGKRDADEVPEVGAEGEVPDAATSAEEASYEDVIAAAEAAASAKAASAEAALNDYITNTKNETESKIEEILSGARKQAEQIISDAKEEAEEERKSGYEKGFEEGSEKGLEEGSAEGKRKYDEMTEAKIREDDETLKRVIDEMYQERERTHNEMEAEATSLAIEIVRKILNPPEEELIDVFTPMIKNALRQMSTDSKITLRVGPKEYERFFSSGAATLELDSGITVKASVLRDVSLNEGDLIIDTDDVTVNAGLDSQLKYVELAFERANQYEPE